MQGTDGKQRDREYAHAATQIADCLAGPWQAEIPAPDQLAAKRTQPGVREAVFASLAIATTYPDRRTVVSRSRRVGRITCQL